MINVFSFITYKNIRKEEGEDFIPELKDCLQKEGPSFILLKVGRDPAEKMPRVNIPPVEIARRFKDS